MHSSRQLVSTSDAECGATQQLLLLLPDALAWEQRDIFLQAAKGHSHQD